MEEAFNLLIQAFFTLLSYIPGGFKSQLGIHEDGTAKLAVDDASARQFWWETTGRSLQRMLDQASYPMAIRGRCLDFYHSQVIPEYGHPPIEGVSPFPSDMTDDHSPIELGCVLTSTGISSIKFAIDPIRRHQEGFMHPLTFFQDMALALSSQCSAKMDLTWCKICASVLTIRPHDDVPGQHSQCSAGFEFSTAGTGMRAYFLPNVISSQTGDSKEFLIQALVQELARQSNVPSSKLPLAWDEIMKFCSTLDAANAPAIQFISVDCVPAAENRLKVYIRSPRVTFKAIKCYLTLGGKLDTPETIALLRCVSYFWGQLFPGLPEDEEPHLPDHRLHGHPTSGILYYYEIRNDLALPLPKVYIPVRHLCQDDEQIASAVETLQREFMLTESQYASVVQQIFPHRHLSAGTGLHTYVTFAAKRTNTEIAVYFSPECFRRRKEV